MTIETKQELIEYLIKTKSSEIDRLFVLDIKEDVIRGFFKDREEDDRFWSEKLEKAEEEIKKLGTELKRIKIQKENWKRVASKEQT